MWWRHDLFIDVHIVTCHTLIGKVHFKVLPTARAIELRDSVHRFHRLVDAVEDEPCNAIWDDLRNRSIGVSNDWSSASHGFDHYQSERFWPVNREQEGCRIAQKLLLIHVSNLADKLHQWMIE